MKNLTFTALAFAGCAMAATWDPALNFNAVSVNPVNASSVFSYGTGGTPGAFAAMGVAAANCINNTTPGWNGAAPNFCYDNGAGFPGASTVVWNGSGGELDYYSIRDPSGVLAMDPQASAGTIVRFTAPWTDVYSVSGYFEAVDISHHTTDAYVYVNNTQQFSTVVNTGWLVQDPIIGVTGIALNAGDTIDFIVKTDNPADGSYMTTGLVATITSRTNGPATPEPGTVVLFGAAGLLVAGLKRLRGKAAAL
jgi:hypothetical protein